MKGLSAGAVERIFAARNGGASGKQLHTAHTMPKTETAAPLPFRSLFDFRARTGIAPSDLRVLIKVGALDSLSDGWTRPMMLWLVDSGVGR